jgi:hypothetical protein
MSDERSTISNRDRATPYEPPAIAERTAIEGLLDTTKKSDGRVRN